MLGHMAILCLAVWGTAKLFSTANAPFHILTSNVEEFQLAAAAETQAEGLVHSWVTLKLPGIFTPPQIL